MLNKENNPHENSIILEKLLLLLYNIDVKLNEVFKCTSVSFSKSSALFKSIFKPLQAHHSNVVKLLSHPGISTINLQNVKDSLTAITTKLQFHDVIEQRLKHIRQIHNEIIQDLITRKKLPDKRTADLGYIQTIAQINAAQVTNINNEYISYCKTQDESLQSIRKYLSDCTQVFSTGSLPAADEDSLFFIEKNSELGQKITGTINLFTSDIGYRDLFSKTVAEIGKSLNSISSEIKVKEKLPSNHIKLKKLENLYTTQGERDIFNKLVYAAVKSEKQSHSYKNDSGVDLF